MMRKSVLFAAAAVWAGAACAMESIDLNGLWDFRLAKDASLEDVKMPDFAPDSKMVVPGCWDAMSHWYNQRGTGCYRRSFMLAHDAVNAFLVIDGVGLRSRYWVDGREIGFSKLPWSKFQFETGPLKAGRHEIVCAVDSIVDNSKVKLFWNFYDFYPFGGFHHGVRLDVQRLAVEPRRVVVRTRDFRTGLVELEVQFAGEGPSDFTAAVSFDGGVARQVAFKGGRAQMPVPNFRLWSPATPNLHTVTVALSSRDRPACASARFGVRQVGTANGRITLNGEPVYLKGVNRHESHYEFGATTPVQLMYEDIRNLKDLGGNFIRGSHYAQCEAFLDLCDELGVMVWEESLGWGNKPKQLEDPEFCDLQEEETRLMVRNSINHPCVIISAFLNEPDSNLPSCLTLVDRLIGVIRAEDTGHLVTFACHRTANDICHTNTDIIAYNTYPCWYHHELKTGTAEEMRNNIRQCHTDIVKYFREKFKDGRPILVSETGVKADYGARDPRGKAQYTEDFQEEYERIMLEEIFANREIAGIAIWQFTDAKTYTRTQGLRNRSYGVNTGGLYDLYRRPKLVVETIRKLFREKDEIPGADERELPLKLVPAPQRVVRKEGMYRSATANPPIAESRDASLPPEGYRLSVKPDGISVTSADDAGAFYARQTLSQLAAVRDGSLVFPCVEIEDFPAFRWRGLMLDESRHFFGMKSVKRFLTLMAQHKLNVFHWHLTDNQGWRIQIDRYPELTTVASKRPYSKAHKHLLDSVPEGAPGEYGPFFYTKDEIREILAFAAERHIRVVPEIEIPGHSRAPIRAFPELLCFADDPSLKPTNAIDNAYCAGNDKVLRFLENVLDEVCELFPDPVVHIGGDEVQKANWKACPKCQARMAAVGAKTPEELQAWMNGHFAQYLAKKGKRPIWWGEIPEGEIPANLAVMSWLGPECGIAAAKKGHEVVMCPHKSLYFDYTPCVPADSCTYPYFTAKLPVSKVYAYDPLAGIPAEFHKYVLGGEGCNWTEYTYSQKDLDWKCWTRAAAMAEVLWTAPKSRDLKAFLPRLRAHVEHLKALGVNCAPAE